MSSKKLAPTTRAPLNPSMPPAKYPWDSHQNALVNSVELTGPQQRPTGVAHYRQILEERRSYPKICIDFAKEYAHEDGRGAPSDAMLDSDTSQCIRSNLYVPSMNYTACPAPPSARSDYSREIYHVTTFNTAVCLAIIRIAEKNLPFIDFISATKHLPNLAPSDPLPTLIVGTLAGDVPFSHLPTDVTITIAFLPEFYSDRRHALGYYVLLPSIVDPSKDRITTAVFTPCTTADLEDWDMVLYQEGKEGDGIHHIDVVGVRGGRWLKPDIGEHWGHWRVVWWVLERWEKRVVKTLSRATEDEGVGVGRLAAWRV
ncbi:hypothetical protein J1614_005441 [Plenodomus biglobosus]|nr:hypothetical protein J1614_005441 [Plenodomus biglobosus]